MTAATRSRICIVTGAAGGIGAGLVDMLDASGDHVLAGDVDSAALERAVAERAWTDAVTPVTFDVRDRKAWNDVVDEAVAANGRLDLVCNVAGYLLPGDAASASEDAVDRHIDINVKGTIFGTQAAARAMTPQRSGNIVNIGSLAALSPVPGLSLYCASKFAVRGFTLSTALELRPHNIFVTLVCPDAVQTPMLDLQMDYPEAALTFSGSKALTTKEVVDTIGRCLERNPLEVSLPPLRGAMAKLAGAFPDIGRLMLPAMRRSGLARQRTMRGEGP